MANKRLRKIVIDEQTYLWKFAIRCDSMYSSDRFTAYLQTYRASPLIISFRTRDDYLGGSPLGIGKEIIEGNPSTGGINLYHPKWAATLIRQGLERGWKPDQQSNTHRRDKMYCGEGMGEI